MPLASIQCARAPAQLAFVGTCAQTEHLAAGSQPGDRGEARQGGRLYLNPPSDGRDQRRERRGDPSLRCERAALSCIPDTRVHRRRGQPAHPPAHPRPCPRGLADLDNCPPGKPPLFSSASVRGTGPAPTWTGKRLAPPRSLRPPPIRDPLSAHAALWLRPKAAVWCGLGAGDRQPEREPAKPCS
jgi:hypothetical protein